MKKNKKYKNSYIEKDVKIGENVTIYPNCYILGKSEIKDGCIIYPNTTIENSVIDENSIVKASYIEESYVGPNCSIGPFSHLRPKSHIDANCKIGNFVEIKNSTLDSGTKASHLAYIGDCDIGKNCNIGCGAIFVNYNGKSKNRCSVGDNSFIGSNCNIIAPVTIAKNSYICAGTTLTINTNENDFVIGRSRETVKENRAKNYFKKYD